MKKWFKEIFAEVVIDLFGEFKDALKEIVTDLFGEFMERLGSALTKSLKEEKSPPIEVFTRLSAEDVVRYGEALDELAQGPHYKYLVELVKRRRSEVGEMVLAGDGKQTLEYWKGFRDGAESLEILVDPMRRNAQTLIEEKKGGGTTLKDLLGMGDGPLS